MAMKNVETFYPLSPMQQGMLFHSLYAPETGVYVEQLSCTLRGDLDVEAFRRTWQHLLNRHPILRTAFLWEGLKEPVQVVQRQVEVPLTLEDWRDLPPDRQSEQLAAFLEAEQTRGFELSKAPLIRVALLRTAVDAYEFVWTHHHILLDGWSIPLLLQEIFAAYETFQAGQVPRLPAPRPFRDYIVWLKRQNMADAERFWRDTLKGFYAPTPIMVNRLPQLAPAERQGHTELEVNLSPELTARLQTTARNYQVTLNTLVQGAWALLLSRYSGETDVVFGTTVSGRPAELKGAETMMGLFINTLPMRVQLPPETSVGAWLQTLQAQQAELRQYEYTPLMQVQGWSEVPGGIPLFESILVFENFPIDTALGGSGTDGQKRSLQVRNVHTTSHTNYPLTIVAVPDREMLLKIAYDRELFAAGTIERMMGHLETLLSGMAADPEQLVTAVPLIPPDERQYLLTAWNALDERYAQSPCVHEWVAAQAARTPDATAVTFEDQRLTYRELDERANQLGHYLQTLSVGPDVMVALYLERSLEMIVGILGILKAGGAYVPMDPVYPAERLAFLVEDTQAPVLLTQQHMVASLPAVPKATVVRLDSDWETIAQQPTHAPGSDVGPANMAYVIYTSGSTGKPKGVMVTHANVVRLFTATERWYRFNASDVWTLFHSYAFDFSVWEIWGALFYGGRLVVVPYLVSRSPEQFYRLLQDEQVTVLNQTPSAFRQLIRAEERVGMAKALALRYVIFGGEALELESLRPWYARHGDQKPQLVNMYGITETTVHVTYRPLTLQDIDDATGSVIGVPIPDLQVYILDQNLEPMPIGVPGEIHVGGDGVARGYRNRPELTQEKFIPNPFGTGRLYRSGDLARYLPDGDIEYLGRIDHQIKIRGFRIELGEIESVLVQHPAVREAIVLAREDQPEAGSPSHKRIVAYAVPVGSELPGVEELRSFMKQQIPEYMVPSVFVEMEALPLTAHGKIDRRALPVPDQVRLELETQYVAPRSTAEETLANIWSKLLNVAQVGVHDNFFALGGDSILSIQVIDRAKQAGLELTPRLVFEHPTIAELAAALDDAEAVSAEQGLISGTAPLTPVQHWFFDHHSYPQQFNTSMLLEVGQPLNPQVLEAAVAALMHHHDALRLRFERDGDAWLQVNDGALDAVPFEHIELRAVSAADKQTAIETAVANLQASFDPTSGPLVRVAYLDFGPGESHRLAFIFHHLITDGVSWRIFLDDFITAYRQSSQGRTVALPPKTSAYQEWAWRLHALAQTEQMQAELAYWEQIGHAELEPLPVDFVNGRNTYGTTESLTLSLTQDETHALLKEVPVAFGTQINDVLLTALTRALARWTGTRTLLVEMEGHGREPLFDDIDLSRTIGWFTSIYPVLIDLENAPDLPAELAAANAQLRAIPQNGIGYGILQYLCADESVRRTLQALPQPQINFNYLGQFNQMPDAAEAAGSTPYTLPMGMAAESVGPEQHPDDSRSAQLYIVGVVGGGEFALRCLYSCELHTFETIDAILRAYLDELRAIIHAAVRTTAN